MLDVQVFRANTQLVVEQSQIAAKGGIISFYYALDAARMRFNTNSDKSGEKNMQTCPPAETDSFHRTPGIHWRTDGRYFQLTPHLHGIVNWWDMLRISKEFVRIFTTRIAYFSDSEIMFTLWPLMRFIKLNTTLLDVQRKTTREIYLQHF